MNAKKGLFAALVAGLCAIAIVCGALLGSLARLHTRDIVMMDESAEAVDGGLSFAVEPLAAWLQVPYFLWVTFAAYLNFGVWWLSR